jgi:hypothetical protein
MIKECLQGWMARSSMKQKPKCTVKKISQFFIWEKYAFYGLKFLTSSKHH